MKSERKEIWDYEVSQQDITIAKVVLAGWVIGRYTLKGDYHPTEERYRYYLIKPNGQATGGIYRTRYTAALAAYNAIQGTTREDGTPA